MTVIIPVYNAERFLRRCIDSVLGQSMPDLELIAVNDGSTDASLDILRDYAADDPRVVVIDQVNAGQGAARNRALDLARGEYVLFVDADDFIERVTLQVTTERANEDRSDLVHFDWKLLSEKPEVTGRYHYYNADPFWHKRLLEGIECDELLRVENFYSVSNLYRREYLNRHGIRFEEGRIYEDNPFVLQVVNRAECVSMVHSPLYVIDPHPESSTRSQTDTDKHYRDHIYAIRRSFELLERRNPRAAAYLAAYHIKKIGPYYERRIPRRFRRAYIKDFVDILHEAQVEIPDGTATNRPTRTAVRLRMFERRRYLMFQALVAGKNHVMPRYKRAKWKLRQLKRRNDRGGAWAAELEAALDQPIIDRTISFLGLDFKYAGNSRYLFDEVIADPRFDGWRISFVTNDQRVPEPYRVKPELLETNQLLARSQVVIAESWIPPRVRKHRDSTWVQLWHGTPLKRMLFDSHEPRIIWNRRHHKIVKYRDIQNWDYLVVDSPIAAEKFETAFLFDPERMIHSGYPRVKYLLEQRGNAALREDIAGRVGMSGEPSRKVALYAPTWRDYNYARSADDSDFDYVLDVERLADELGDEWVVIFHDHGYLSSHVSTGNERCIDASSIEIQELLLISDVVVSDYSSVIFDAMAIDVPFVLYTPDLEQFEEFRGVYGDMWEELEGFAVRDVKGTADSVRNASPMNAVPRAMKAFLYSASAEPVSQLLCSREEAEKDCEDDLK
ncbi:CDP-glycerol glycerophosphotransferase family protein [Leucobacter triazinivorans]|uniref:CDP-glycerol glycerophosphotransferase family protein n=1 Tax=Leucobacter triazinivorans TaxID=1784719 RepID=UPI0013EE4CFE|nr:CDP-glycerol glycerophosphotransferase family protein [Leucobacter triazinivorans]